LRRRKSEGGAGIHFPHTPFSSRPARAKKFFRNQNQDFRQKKFGFRPADTTRDDLSCPRPSRSLPRTELVLVRGSGRRKNPKNLTGSPRSSKTAKEPEKISARTTFCLPRSDQSDWSTTGVKEKFYSFRG